MSPNREVTDPNILAQLERTEVTDPSVLAQLNGNDSEVPRDKFISDLWEAAKNIGSTAGRGIPAIINQGVTNPTRVLKNIGAGLVSIPLNVGNAVLNTPQYIAGLHSKPVSDWLKRFTPEIPTERIVNAASFEPTESDKSIRELAALAPILGPLGKGLAKGVAGTAKAVGGRALGKTDRALEANEALLGNKVEAAASELEQKTEAAQAAEEAHKQAISESKQALGKSDADLMQYDLGNRQQKIQNMMDESEQLKDQLKAVKPEETELPAAEENLSKSTEAVANAKNMGSDLDTHLGQLLNKGAQHDVRVAQGLTHRLASIEDYWSDAYKTFQRNIADANFQMPRAAMDKLDYSNMSPMRLIQQFGPEAFEALKKGKIDEFINKKKSAESGNTYLDHLMEAAPTASDTNAADFLAKYKDFRDRTFNLSKRLRDPRVEEVEKQKMQSALDNAKKMQVQMKEVLDAGLGEFKPEFERVNKGYSEQIYPLRENKLVDIENGKMKVNKLPDNIMKTLRTNEEGMPLIREIVKQDPELLRNVVGQRYFSKPNELHNPNETMREYLDEAPEIKDILSQRQQANSALEQAQSNAEVAKQHHAEVVKRSVESEKIQAKLNDMWSDIQRNQSRNEEMKTHIEALKKTGENKKISLAEKVKTEAELKKLKRELKQSSDKLDRKVSGLRKFLRAYKMIYRSGKFITTGRL